MSRVHCLRANWSPCPPDPTPVAKRFMHRGYHLDLIVGRDVDDVAAIAEEIKEDDEITVTVDSGASRVEYREPQGGFYLVDYRLSAGTGPEHIRGKHVLAAAGAFTDEQARQAASMTWVRGLPYKSSVPPKAPKVARLLSYRG